VPELPSYGGCLHASPSFSFRIAAFLHVAFLVQCIGFMTRKQNNRRFPMSTRLFNVHIWIELEPPQQLLRPLEADTFVDQFFFIGDYRTD
jgi:hypothetical protein